MEDLGPVEAAIQKVAKEKKKKKKKKAKVQKRGRTTVTVSAGSRFDDEEGKSGSRQDPEVKRSDEDQPVRTLEEGYYSKVAVTLGMTRSLGNYEFARVDVSVEDFCAMDKKDDTFEQLHKTCTGYLGKVMKDVDGFLKKKRERESGQSQPSVMTEVKA